MPKYPTQITDMAKLKNLKFWNLGGRISYTPRITQNHLYINIVFLFMPKPNGSNGSSSYKINHSCIGLFLDSQLYCIDLYDYPYASTTLFWLQ